MTIISRKHWVTYFGYFLLLLLGLSLISNFLLTNVLILTFFPLILGSWITYKSLKGTLLNYFTTWIFDNNILTVKKGFLPWKRTNFSTDITQIFEAIYSSSFLGTIFGYSTIKIRRTDGVVLTP